MPDLISVPTISWQGTNTDNKIEGVRKTLNSEKLRSEVNSNHELEKACSELESLFIYYLLKEMRATVPKSGFLGGGKAEDIYTSMLDSQLAKDLSSKGGIGLSSMLLNQLNRMQGYTRSACDYAPSQAED
jgi:flagellar protein FlgJ